MSNPQPGVVAVLLLAGSAAAAHAQAVEVFAGHQAMTADVLFVEYFPDRAGQATPWLLFHRSRAVVDHDIDTAAQRDLPQFGMTNAVSWNPKAWRGLGPVAAVSITTGSVAAKVGTQYARVSPRATIFGWVVVETAARPSVDLFVLARHVRPLSTGLGLFTQVESINALAIDGVSTFTVRGRVGVAWARWQAGVGTDLRRTTAEGAGTNANVGVFLRHAF